MTRKSRYVDEGLDEASNVELGSHQSLYPALAWLVYPPGFWGMVGECRLASDSKNRLLFSWRARSSCRILSIR